MTKWLPVPEIIRQENPSDPIILYDGETQLIDKNKKIEGESIIQVLWYPYPRITVTFIYYGEDRVINNNVELKLNKLPSKPHIKVHLPNHTYYGTGKNELCGYLSETFRQGQTDNLSSVTFYVTNFVWFDCGNTWGAGQL